MFELLFDDQGLIVDQLFERKKKKEFKEASESEEKNRFHAAQFFQQQME